VSLGHLDEIFFELASAVAVLKQNSKKFAGRRRVYFFGSNETAALLVLAMRIETQPVKSNIQGAASPNGCSPLSAKFEIPQSSKE
jgi:hypothetical protein